LQLAVRGRLVPQDPADEPASALLERIAKEKARLVKEGKLRNEKPLAPIKPEEVPFELSEGWAWTYLGTLASLINGDRGKNYPSRSHFVDSGVPFINAGHLVRGEVSLEEMNYISEERFRLLRS